MAFLQFLNDDALQHLILLRDSMVPGGEVMAKCLELFRAANFASFPLWDPIFDKITCGGQTYRFAQPDWHGLPEEIKLLLLEFCVGPPQLAGREKFYATIVSYRSRDAAGYRHPKRVFLSPTDLTPTPESVFLNLNWRDNRLQFGKKYKRICEAYWTQKYLSPHGRTEAEVTQKLQCSLTAYIEPELFRAVSRSLVFDDLRVLQYRDKKLLLVPGLNKPVEINHAPPDMVAMFSKCGLTDTFLGNEASDSSFTTQFQTSLDYEHFLRPWDTEKDKNKASVPNVFTKQDMPTWDPAYVWTGRMCYKRTWMYEARRAEGEQTTAFPYSQVCRMAVNLWRLRPMIVNPVTQLSGTPVEGVSQLTTLGTGRYLIDKPRHYTPASQILQRLFEKKPKALFAEFSDVEEEAKRLAKQIYNLPTGSTVEVFGF